HEHAFSPFGEAIRSRVFDPFRTTSKSVGAGVGHECVWGPGGQGDVDPSAASGKVRYVGASNYAAWQMMKSLATSDHMDPARLALADEVVKLAAELGTSATALSLAWLMHRPAVATVIAGATREMQIDENLKAVDLELSADTLARLDEISEDFIYARPFGSAPRKR
ncbi:MAG: aldo/keto reductase, partial [Alicyclobacillus sp.]|nr:aldo/keto reductase [Alicyclobacillus sp.]